MWSPTTTTTREDSSLVTHLCRTADRIFLALNRVDLHKIEGPTANEQLAPLNSPQIKPTMRQRISSTKT